MLRDRERAGISLRAIEETLVVRERRDRDIYIYIYYFLYYFLKKFQTKRNMAANHKPPPHLFFKNH